MKKSFGFRLDFDTRHSINPTVGFKCKFCGYRDKWTRLVTPRACYDMATVTDTENLHHVPEKDTSTGDTRYCCYNYIIPTASALGCNILTLYIDLYKWIKIWICHSTLWTLCSITSGTFEYDKSRWKMKPKSQWYSSAITCYTAA